ncbi:ABC transporter substrate-binding protein [Anabaena cylindrica FACHB-243]|uniref:ABC-type transporter, periplasmic subunit n=1 Tax=Anabaena cylindrica (strain ATCC 27899 / PCC 7122) TaxID=272123 RepID=K9ZFT0_ANACC|nr:MULTISPECIES: ABC transporter substrate-binding protein [Anabaena]AFZ58083.1 ABC-type transporter, periplasmic subunit [Anabaena cylindrica PCC 7122]MBD2419142.1 ABC transporter substrate-binding protein [Anabaena cylindrica FACHB-243]MBY5284037.1 ABC transporter substrate-binding protein [Anabaena sp. CCAP 1446/1C]MBY5306826.1 ABC transporter substrate-binding protein [Anabaena sp. CCAP 1446/1C]MCM2409613.1 ABC transporter substrate-binding protein [Anabaena sp. CCAP 1446/1C]
MSTTKKISNSIKRFFLLITILSFTAISITACNPTKLKSDAAQVPQLVTSILSDPKTFNYALNSDANNIFGYTYEGLISQNPLTGKLEPNLAESWQVSEDKLKITFTLRDNLKWSDGQPLTADDVVFSYNDIYLNEAIPTNVRDILRIGKDGKFPTIKKIDKRRVEFSIPEPFRPFLQNSGVPILPAHALRESIQTKDQDGKPKFLTKWGVDTPPEELIVNGPYKLERYDTSQRVIFRRNPYYWRKDAQGNPQPYIQRIIWQIVESTDTSLLQFRSGGLDAVGVTPDYFSLLKVQEKQGNFSIENGGPSTSTSFVLFNLNKGKRAGKPLIDPIKSRWFNSVEFRQAIAYAIDRKTMINNTFRGLGKTQDSPISVQSPYYLSPEKGLKVYNYNLEKAKQLLLKAGFKYNAQNQLEDAEGNRVRFALLTNAGNKIREAMGSQIKQDLSKIGIQVDFTPLAWNTFVDKLSNTLDWEASLLGLTGGLEPNDGANVWSPEGGLHMFNQKPQPGQKPIEGWEVSPWEEKIHALYIQGAQEFDEAKVKEIYAESQRLTQENLPFIYLVNSYSMTAIRNRFEGLQYSALGGAFWNIHEIKITE